MCQNNGCLNPLVVTPKHAGPESLVAIKHPLDGEKQGCQV